MAPRRREVNTEIDGAYSPKSADTLVGQHSLCLLCVNQTGAGSNPVKSIQYFPPDREWVTLSTRKLKTADSEHSAN